MIQLRLLHLLFFLSFSNFVLFGMEPDLKISYESLETPEFSSSVMNNAIAEDNVRDVLEFVLVTIVDKKRCNSKVKLSELILASEKLRKQFKNTISVADVAKQLSTGIDVGVLRNVIVFQYMLVVAFLCIDGMLAGDLECLDIRSSFLSISSIITNISFVWCFPRLFGARNLTEKEVESLIDVVMLDFECENNATKCLCVKNTQVSFDEKGVARLICCVESDE